jgi:hypothetical protein
MKMHREGRFQQHIVEVQSEHQSGYGGELRPAGELGASYVEVEAGL